MALWNCFFSVSRSENRTLEWIVSCAGIADVATLVGMEGASDSHRLLIGGVLGAGTVVAVGWLLDAQLFTV